MGGGCTKQLTDASINWGVLSIGRSVPPGQREQEPACATTTQRRILPGIFPRAGSAGTRSHIFHPFTGWLPACLRSSLAGPRPRFHHGGSPTHTAAGTRMPLAAACPSSSPLHHPTSKSYVI